MSSLASSLDFFASYMLLRQERVGPAKAMASMRPDTTSPKSGTAPLKPRIR